jgi:ZIP family zinc transporter
MMKRITQLVLHFVLLWATGSSKPVPFRLLSKDAETEESGSAQPASVEVALSFTLIGFAAHFIGSCLPFVDSVLACTNRPYRILQSKTFLAGTLSFASGILVFTSYSLLFRKASEQFESETSDRVEKLWTGGFYFVGVLTFALLGRVAKWMEDCGPSRDNADEAVESDATLSEGAEDVLVDVQSQSAEQPKQHLTDNDRKGLLKLSVKTLAAMALHNIPEGVVTFTTARADLTFGAVVAFAIIFHNIPEGLTSVAPLYYATGSKKLAFFLAILAGLAEPLGALLAWAFLPAGISPFANAIICAFTAGALSYIPIQGLLPTARQMDPADSVSTLCFFCGILSTITGMGLLSYFCN